MRQAPWWGRQPLEDLLIGYASPLTEGLYGNGWVRLDQPLPVEVGDVLLVREAFRDHPRTNELLQHLLEQISRLSAGHPEVVIHRDVNAYVV